MGSISPETTERLPSLSGVLSFDGECSLPLILSLARPAPQFPGGLASQCAFPPTKKVRVAFDTAQLRFMWFLIDLCW